MISLGSKSYLINFGGDILGYNTNAKIHIENSNVTIERSGSFCIFTSGNTDKRGNHIKISEDDYLISEKSIKTCTVVINGIDPIWCDYLSTSHYSGNYDVYDDSEEVYFVDDKGNLVTHPDRTVYVASPFFNESEIAIRDKMITNLICYFRPDQTDSSKKYSISPGSELSRQIFDDNIRELNECELLIFPELTNDLGTLFEVGVALRLNKPIIRFNHITNSYTVLDSNKIIKEIPNKSIIKCVNSASAVLLGYNYENKDLKYDIGILNDNIMLAETFDRVELIDGAYRLVVKNYKEIK